jgi:ATP synthase I chain
METIRQTQKKYGTRAMVVAIVVGFALIVAVDKSLGKGLVLGTLFSIINFVLIGETLPAKIGHARKKTFLFSMLSIFFRYALMAIPVILAIKFQQFGLVTTIMGLFMVQIVILGDHLIRAVRPTRHKKLKDTV